MDSAGEAVGFPFRSPGWLRTVLLQGLILVIPVVGAISLLGWLMLTVDNLRAGRQELAPAGLHLERGISLFGVLLIYGAVLAIAPEVVCAIGIATVASGSSAVGALLPLGGLITVVGGLLSAFLLPVLVLRTSQGGFRAGMDIGAVWRQATANVGQTMVAALLIYVVYLVSCLMVFLFVLPFFPACAWSCGVAAGVVSWYERAQSAAVAQTT